MANQYNKASVLAWQPCSLPGEGQRQGKACSLAGDHKGVLSCPPEKTHLIRKLARNSLSDCFEVKVIRLDRIDLWGWTRPYQTSMHTFDTFGRWACSHKLRPAEVT